MAGSTLVMRCVSVGYSLGLVAFKFCHRTERDVLTEVYRDEWM